MKDLHVAFEVAKLKLIFEGVKVGSNKVDISHLQFADDSLIMGKWSRVNAQNLCRLLSCFNLASGLKVNFSKSKFFGIGVSASESQNFASFLNRQPSTLPCSYLGLPIGANMNKICNWKPIIDKFHKRLTPWKARTLSYGGRLTLLKSLRRNFFWGGTLDTNKMAWMAWPKVCSSTNCGGLGIGSLHAANLAMLVKWGFGTIDSPMPSMPLSPWKKIIELNKPLSHANYCLQSIFKRKVGNGNTFRFWEDWWIGESSLKSLFLRLFLLEVYKDCKIIERCTFTNGLLSPNWTWRRNIRDGVEKSQLDDMLLLLRDFSLVDTPDSWQYTLDASNTFYVR
ncbi:hypothetical protein Tco_0815657 [Tanacetum coccineum]